MRYLLDTNAVIALAVESQKNIVQRAGECDTGDLVTPSIVLAEIALCTGRGDPPSMDLLRAFIEEDPVLDFDYKAALAYASLPFRRASFGRLIAAHALSHDLTVITEKLNDFADLSGLRVENWTV